MFKLSFLVEDKNLPKVLHGIAGLAINMEVPKPVANGVLQKPGRKVKVVQANAEGGIGGALLAELHNFDGSEITVSAIRDLIQKVGGQPGSRTWFIQKMIKAKALKKTKIRGLYTVIKGE